MSPEEDFEDGQRTAVASTMRTGWDRVVHPGEKKALGRPFIIIYYYYTIPVPKGDLQEIWIGIFHKDM